eukprot:SAG11_NODE_480_length_9107_cov_7.433171_5_plen_129_part_00
MMADRKTLMQRDGHSTVTARKTLSNTGEEDDTTSFESHDIPKYYHSHTHKFLDLYMFEEHLKAATGAAEDRRSSVEEAPAVPQVLNSIMEPSTGDVDKDWIRLYTSVRNVSASRVNCKLIRRLRSAQL